MARSTSRPAPGPRWLGPAAALGGVFLLALIWRLAYLERVSRAGLLSSLPGDERVYWDWATYLLAHDFWGTNPFFFGPLYPYVLAAIRRLSGPEVHAVLVVQSVWGAAAAVLLTDAARRVAGWSAGIAVGTLYALYEMNVFFDGLILMESLLLFLGALLLWLWTHASERPPRLLHFALIGIVTGLIALGRASGALLLLPACWLARPFAAETTRPAIARVAALVLAFLITVAPATIHNWRAEGEFIPLTYNFGLNFYIGNHAEATGRYMWVAGPQYVDAVKGLRPDGGIESDGRAFLESQAGTRLSARQSSAIWASRAWSWIVSDPLGALRLAGSKVVLLWNRREQYQIENADVYRERAGPLGLPLLGTFAVVAVIGLLGAAQSGIAPRLTAALRIHLLVYTLGMLPFFVTDRYRIHLVPVLIMLAPVAIQAWRSRRRIPGGMRRFVLPAVLATALVVIPISEPSERLKTMLSALDMGTRWLDQGRPDLAVAEYTKGLDVARSREAEQLTDPETRAALFFNYAYALRATGEPQEALAWFRRAAETAPGNARFLRTLGDAYLAAGRHREGDSLLARAEALIGSESEVLMSRGYRAARDGRHAAAESLFATATRENMRNYAAWGALIRIQVQQQALDRATATLRDFERTGVPVRVARLYAAFVAAASGDAVRARSLLDEAAGPAPSDDPTLAWVRSTTERMIAAGQP